MQDDFDNDLDVPDDEPAGESTIADAEMPEERPSAGAWKTRASRTA